MQILNEYYFEIKYNAKLKKRSLFIAINYIA